MSKKSVKDIMVSSSEYPQISSSDSLRKAIEIFRQVVITGEKCVKPVVALVFDGSRIVGTLRLRDIIKGLQPGFLRSSLKAEGYNGSTRELAIIWDSLFADGTNDAAKKPVREAMSPVISSLGPDDSIAQAAYAMISEDLIIIPVLEGDKLLGLVRMIEVFEALVSNLPEQKRSKVTYLRIEA